MALQHRVTSRFSPLIDALNTIHFEKRDADVKDVQDLFLRPNVILFMLLLANVLVYFNRFLHFLQIHSLVYLTIYGKLAKLTNNLKLAKQRRVLLQTTWEKVLRDHKGKVGTFMVDPST